MNYIYSKYQIINECKLNDNQFKNLLKIYNFDYEEKESKQKVKSKYFTQETLDFIKNLKENNKLSQILKEHNNKSNPFKILQNYKSDNNLYSQNELIKIWKTQKPKFWIKHFNLSEIKYVICENRITYLYKKDEVDKVTEFLKELEKNKHPQVARQEYIMKIEKGITWSSLTDSWKIKMKGRMHEMTRKMKETCLKKYGYDSCIKNEDVKNKRRITNINRYGEDYGKYFVSKSKETILKKYGDYQKFNHHKLNEVSKVKYLWDGIKFDSKWEIYYYQYLKDNDIPFKYHLKGIEYYHNSMKHIYYPDFKVYDRIVEIKSDYLYKYMTENKNTKEYSKYKCMIDNDVLILQQKDIQPYKEWFNKKYHVDLNLYKLNNKKDDVTIFDM